MISYIAVKKFYRTMKNVEKDCHVQKEIYFKTGLKNLY